MLVVDDEPGMRQMLEGTFRDRGFHVTTASNGSKAIEVIQEQPFDVIITDLKMPERDGLAVLRSARASAFDSPVIMITATAPSIPPSRPCASARAISSPSRSSSRKLS